MSSFHLSPNWPFKIQILEKEFDVTRIISTFDFLVTEARKQKIERIVKLRSRSCVPILENIYDRGNTSAVMRSAESFGFFDFHIIDKSKDFKESSRVTQGADKWLNVNRSTNTYKTLTKLKIRGVKIYTTALTQTAIEIKDLDFSSDVAFVFGNEKDGVSKEALDLSDGNILIPMVGFTQSFNISVAAALCFQEARKISRTVSEEEANALKASYILNSLQLSHDQMLSLLV